MRPFFLLARPRSGTTVFRDVLSNCAKVLTFGEIFHDSVTDKASFLPWYKERLQQDQTVGMPTPGNRTMLFRDYLAFVESQVPDHRKNDPVILTVNYNSLHILNAIWQNLFDAPFLCRLIVGYKCGVIHMIRKNCLRSLISEAKAKRYGVWHVTEASQPAAERGPIHVDVDRLVPDLTNRAREIELIDSFFGSYDRRLTLYYEDLFHDAGAPDETLVREALAFLGTPLTSPMTTKYQRTSQPDLAAEVSNWQEVVERLRGTPFEAMAS